MDSKIFFQTQFNSLAQFLFLFSKLVFRGLSYLVFNMIYGIQYMITFPGSQKRYAGSTSMKCEMTRTGNDDEDQVMLEKLVNRALKKRFSQHLSCIRRAMLALQNHAPPDSILFHHDKHYRPFAQIVMETCQEPTIRAVHHGWYKDKLAMERHEDTFIDAIEQENRLNRRGAGRDNAFYKLYQCNYQPLYRLVNRERLDARQNEKIPCDCGCMITRQNILAHQESLKCICRKADLGIL